MCEPVPKKKIKQLPLNKYLIAGTNSVKPIVFHAINIRANHISSLFIAAIASKPFFFFLGPEYRNHAQVEDNLSASSIQEGAPESAVLQCSCARCRVGSASDR